MGETHTRLSVYNLLSNLHLLWMLFCVSKYTVPSWPLSLLSFISSFLLQSTFLQKAIRFFLLLKIQILSLGTRWVTWSAHAWANSLSLFLPVLWWLSGCSHFFPGLSSGGRWGWGSNHSGNIIAARVLGRDRLGDKLPLAETLGQVLSQMSLAHLFSPLLDGTLRGDKGPCLVHPPHS